jgi:hypothetical protein
MTSNKWSRRYRRERTAAQGPAGLAGYEHEGFHGLATPDPIEALPSALKKREQSPEELESWRENDQALDEYAKTRDSIKEQLDSRGMGKSAFEDCHDPVAQKYFDRVGREFERNPELKKMTEGAPNSGLVSGGQYNDLYDVREQADLNLANWAEKTLTQTSCPECAAHLVGSADSYHRGGGIFETPNYFGLMNGFDDKFDFDSMNGMKKPYHAMTEAEQSQYHILSNRGYTHGYRVLTNMMKTLGELALSRGSLCPLHARLK